MKILFSPCHYIYDESTAGSEQSWAFNIADRIASNNIGSIVVTGSKNINSDKKYQIIELQKNKNKLDLSIGSALVFNIKYFLATIKSVKHQTFDVIHHVLPFKIGSTFNLFLLFFRKKKPFIVGPIQSPLTYIDKEVNTSDVRSFKPVNKDFKLGYFIQTISKPLLEFLSKKTLQKADKIIVVNKYTKNILIKNGIVENKILVINPGIDSKRFKNVTFDQKKSNVFELITVGYLTKRKGIDLILKALAEVIKEKKDVRLRILGDGVERENLETLVGELSLNNYVVFDGFVSNDKVNAYYQKAHIFVSMSRSESWGQMYLEAMACGLPVITTKNVGSNEIIKEGETGCLVNQEDYMELSRKIIDLVDDKNAIVRLGENARKEVVSKYDWDAVIIPQYIRLYNSVTKNNEKYYYNNINYSEFLDNQKAEDFEKYVDFVKKYSKDNDRFLDVGCGSGIALNLITNKIHGVGVDISNTSIKKCLDKGLLCQIYNGLELPFENNSFDIVGSFNVLEHVDNVMNFLNEQKRILKKNGYLFLVCPNFLSISNGYHHHTRGVVQKIKNIFVILEKLFQRDAMFKKMKTIERLDFQPDDDACNVTNPIDILKWAKVNSFKLEFWSSQSTYKKGILKYLDFFPLKIFLGSSFMIFKKNEKE